MRTNGLGRFLCESLDAIRGNKGYTPKQGQHPGVDAQLEKEVDFEWEEDELQEQFTVEFEQEEFEEESSEDEENYFHQTV